MFSDFEKTFGKEAETYWKKRIEEIRLLAIEQKWCSECIYAVPYMETVHGCLTPKIGCALHGGIANNTCENWKLRGESQ